MAHPCAASTSASRRRRTLAGLSLAVLTATAAACGSSTPQSSAATTPAKATSAGSSQAQTLVKQYESPSSASTVWQNSTLPSAPPKGKVFVMAYDGTVPSQVAEAKAVQAAAKAIGWTYESVSFSDANTASLISALNTALIKHAAAVGLVAIEPSLIPASVIASYQRAHVAIVMASELALPNNGVFVGPSDGTPQINTDAKALAAWFVDKSGGHGKALWIHLTAIPPLQQETTAFDHEVSTLCGAKCSVKEVDFSLQQLGEGSVNSIVTNAVRANPGYKYVLYDNGDWAQGVTSSLATAAVNGVTIGGINPSGFELDWLRAGKLPDSVGAVGAWAGISLNNIGYGMVDLAARFVEGAPGGGADANQPTQLITTANVANSVGTASRWNQPSNALQQLESVWHVAH